MLKVHGKLVVLPSADGRITDSRYAPVRLAKGGFNRFHSHAAAWHCGVLTNPDYAFAIAFNDYNVRAGQERARAEQAAGNHCGQSFHSGYPPVNHVHAMTIAANSRWKKPLTSETYIISLNLILTSEIPLTHLSDPSPLMSFVVRNCDLMPPHVSPL